MKYHLNIIIPFVLCSANYISFLYLLFCLGETFTAIKYNNISWHLTLRTSSPIAKGRTQYSADQGPVVQNKVSLTSQLRGQLVKCFMTL